LDRGDLEGHLLARRKKMHGFGLDQINPIAPRIKLDPCTNREGNAGQGRFTGTFMINSPRLENPAEIFYVGGCRHRAVYRER
jgi:hypothetical protein